MQPTIQDMSSGEYGHEEREKRKQVNRACESCRKAHAACDEMRPCKRCIGRGEADSCVDRHDSKHQPAHPKFDKLSAARQKEKKAKQREMKKVKKEKARLQALNDIKFKKALHQQMRLQQEKMGRGLESNSQTEHSERTDESGNRSEGESSDFEHGGRHGAGAKDRAVAAASRATREPLPPATLIPVFEPRTPSPMGSVPSGSLSSSVENQDPSVFRGLFEIESVDRYQTKNYRTLAPSSRTPPSASPYVMPSQVGEYLRNVANVLSCTWGDDAVSVSAPSAHSPSRGGYSEFLAL